MSDTADRSAHPSSDHGEARTIAEQAWEAMQDFVATHNRHGELADALGFRLGAGRGKVLLHLRHGPATLGELAVAAGTDAPYTTLVVDRLEAHGLVQRQPHPGDRRRKLVTLTPAGHAAITTTDTIRRRPPHAMTTLSDDDLHHLTTLLTHLNTTDPPSAADL